MSFACLYFGSHVYAGSSGINSNFKVHRFLALINKAPHPELTDKDILTRLKLKRKCTASYYLMSITTQHIRTGGDVVESKMTAVKPGKHLLTVRMKCNTDCRAAGLVTDVCHGLTQTSRPHL